MTKQNFEWADAGERSQRFITVDKYARIQLSAAMVRELNAVDVPVKLYVGYDKNTGRIALAPADLMADKTDKSPHTFSKSHHYSHVKSFLNRHGIDYSQSRRYILVDRHNGAYVFEREDVWDTAGTD